MASQTKLPLTSHINQHSCQSNKPDKHHLLVFSDRLPQVVTEALWALYHQHHIQPEQLEVVTSTTGKEEMLKHLISSSPHQPNKLVMLQADYSLAPLHFNQQQIHLLPHPEHSLHAKRDSIKQEENRDFILRLIQSRTQASNHKLHLVLSGEKRLYTHYVGLAMSLFARQQDSLSYLQIDAALKHSEFFYPTPYSKIIYTRYGSLNAQHAEVNLIDVPFVRQRHLLAYVKRNPQQKQQIIPPTPLPNTLLSLKVDLNSGSLTCSGVAISLPPATLGFYMVLLEEMLDEDEKEGYQCPPANKPDRVLAIKYLQMRLRMAGIASYDDSLQAVIALAHREIDNIQQKELCGLKDGMKASFFNDKKNKIRTALQQALPAPLAQRYGISIINRTKRDNATKPAAYFGINLPKEQVKIIEVE